MPEMRAQNTFTVEADFLRDTLGCHVVRVGDELEALELDLVEPPSGKQPESPRADPLATRLARDPVPDPSSVVHRVHRHADCTGEDVVADDCERVLVRRHLLADE